MTFHVLIKIYINKNERVIYFSILMEYNSFLRALEEEIFSFLYRYTVYLKKTKDVLLDQALRLSTAR